MHTHTLTRREYVCLCAFRKSNKSWKKIEGKKSYYNPKHTHTQTHRHGNFAGEFLLLENSNKRKRRQSNLFAETFFHSQHHVLLQAFIILYLKGNHIKPKRCVLYAPGRETHPLTYIHTCTLSLVAPSQPNFQRKHTSRSGTRNSCLATHWEAQVSILALLQTCNNICGRIIKAARTPNCNAPNIWQNNNNKVR